MSCLTAQCSSAHQMLHSAVRSVPWVFLACWPVCVVLLGCQSISQHSEQVQLLLCPASEARVAHSVYQGEVSWWLQWQLLAA